MIKITETLDKEIKYLEYYQKEFGDFTIKYGVVYYAQESIVFKFATISLEELKDWNGLNFLNIEELDAIIQIANKFENLGIIQFIQNLIDIKTTK